MMGELYLAAASRQALAVEELRKNGAERKRNACQMGND